MNAMLRSPSVLKLLFFFLLFTIPALTHADIPASRNVRSSRIFRRSDSSDAAATATPTATKKGGLSATAIFVIVVLLLLALACIPLVLFVVRKRRMARELGTEDEIPTDLPPKTPKRLRPIINPRSAKFFSPGRDKETEEEGKFNETKWEEVELGRYGVKVKVKEKKAGKKEEVKEPERVRVRWGGRWGPFGA